jgi:hypothetical protein
MAKPMVRELWIKRASEYNSSNMGAAEWCRINNLKKSQLWYWLKKFKDEDIKIKTEWIEANVDAIEPSTYENTMVIKIGLASIEIKTGFDKLLLEDVVQMLYKLC